MNKPFNCWKCTACCRVCDKVPELKEFDKGNGTCIHLQENGDCGIYETRPEICNTGTMYEKHHKSRMTWDKYLEYAEIICKVLESKMKKE